MINFVIETKTFFLDGKNFTYAFYVSESGQLRHLYCGKRIPHDDLRYSETCGASSRMASAPGRNDIPAYRTSYESYPPEITFFGTSDYREATIVVRNHTGDSLLELSYVGYDILENKPKISGMPSMDGGETLVVHLKDRYSEFCADLYYTVYDDASVIARRIVYKNGSSEKVRLERAYSFAFSLPSSREYDVISLYGAWAKERHIDRIPLPHGIISIDSKRTASSAVLNPFIALVEKDTTETSGNAFGFSLIYSSSYALKAQKNIDGSAIVLGGIQDFDFGWVLEAGEEFETPEAVIAFSSEGLGGMSRAFHDTFRNHLINKRFVNAPRPLVINNWEATYFSFDNQKLKAIVDAVEGTGIDTFVLDDGWFGKRDNDRSGLGDWVVNEKKLEGGLSTIIDYVHSKGMKFGLWFEPEMVSEDSDLFRAHPDYAIGMPNRPRCYSRNQFMLDITRKDVRDYIVDSVNKILSENKIEYVKWDFNRNVTDSYSIGREPERQSEFAHRYALGLYDLCERIVNANPDIFFEGCSGGGARFDPAILYYFPQIWTSDDTDAEERTFIQYGTSLVYPLSSMSCHVSICPNHQTGRTTPFSTRANIAHLGATGYELDTTTFGEKDKAEVAKQVEEYRQTQHLILEGDLYRIDDPHKTNFFSETVVSKDKREAILVCYRRMGSVNNEIYRVRVAGLDPTLRYRVSELNTTLSSEVLMSIGVVPNFKNGDFTTVKYHFLAE